ncbi:MAG TPA: hypothetical protein VMF11_00510 [Candidatus Baltobacteraceae bacterium]|nr:hypothetical protein [Candidatus Baltobacteraceae bacterium]
MTGRVDADLRIEAVVLPVDPAYPRTHRVVDATVVVIVRNPDHVHEGMSVPEFEALVGYQKVGEALVHLAGNVRFVVGVGRPRLGLVDARRFG